MLKNHHLFFIIIESDFTGTLIASNSLKAAPPPLNDVRIVLAEEKLKNFLSFICLCCNLQQFKSVKDIKFSSIN
ncbi:hypothetical protein BpHYR1_034483 [Brachionus plicatilis]|uniref:Uncharacterized protein n=1 Tax=Brachionus plicatilis TaxID=10195 RepID=A0A3M7PF00_BRAPC|nr:hypothetical protein BpHYR1_034483 [Brachionus plicatilis]